MFLSTGVICAANDGSGGVADVLTIQKIVPAPKLTKVSKFQFPVDAAPLAATPDHHRIGPESRDPNVVATGCRWTELPK
jgi:hypothetical protein